MFERSPFRYAAFTALCCIGLYGCDSGNSGKSESTDAGWGVNTNEEATNRYYHSEDLQRISQMPVDSTPVVINGTALRIPPKYESINGRGLTARREKQNATIRRMAKQHGVDPALVHAIITRESTYKVQARSHANAQGLMQLLPGTGKKFNCTSLYNPECNVRAGTGYLKFLLKRFNGNLQSAAAGYNAGEGVVDSYLQGTRLPGKNPTGIKTPDGVPLASFSYSAAQKARCPSNNWKPTENCEGETYHYVRIVTGNYLQYKKNSHLMGLMDDSSGLEGSACDARGAC